MQTAKLFLAVAETTAQLQLANQAVTLNKQTVDTILQRVTAGRCSQLDLKAAQISLSDQQVIAKTALQQWLNARNALASLWGGQLSDVPTISISNLGNFPLNDLSKLMKRLDNNPALKALQQQIQVAQGEVSLTRANGIPNVTAGISVRRFNQTKDTAFVAQMTMPIPVFDSNRGNTAKATAQYYQALENYRNQRTVLQQQLFSTYQIALQASMQVNSLQSVTLPKAEQALTLARQGYAEGRYSYLELLNTQQKLLDEKSQYIRSLYSYRNAWFALQVLVGTLPKQRSR